jgi:hypothetical protein
MNNEEGPVLRAYPNNPFVVSVSNHERVIRIGSKLLR